ncbi:MAG: TonB-dependent receptor plug domain-containing protein, partial [Mixta calida]|nr:TonB-dependent receptor plug domain-containing protein [Mixta calida]
MLSPALQAEETTLLVTQQNDNGENGYQPHSSVTANRSPMKIIDTPQNVTVVPQQFLDDRDAQDVDEALGYVSGITQSNTLGGTQDAMIKRGFGDNRDGSILRDGVRSIQARNFTPTSERVEVLKGPSSMLYGMNEPGGLINVISKKPQLTPRVHLEGRSSSVGGGGGQLDGTGPLGATGFAGRLIVDHDETDYWRN